MDSDNFNSYDSYDDTSSDDSDHPDPYTSWIDLMEDFASPSNIVGFICVKCKHHAEAERCSLEEDMALCTKCLHEEYPYLKKSDDESDDESDYAYFEEAMHARL